MAPADNPVASDFSSQLTTPPGAPKRHSFSVKRHIWHVFTRKVVFFGHLPELPVFGRIKPVFCR